MLTPSQQMLQFSTPIPTNNTYNLHSLSHKTKFLKYIYLSVFLHSQDTALQEEISQATKPPELSLRPADTGLVPISNRRLDDGQSYQQKGSFRASGNGQILTNAGDLRHVWVTLRGKVGLGSASVVVSQFQRDVTNVLRGMQVGFVRKDIRVFV